MARPDLSLVLFTTSVFALAAGQATSAVEAPPQPAGSTATAWQAFGDLDGGCDGAVRVIRRAPDGDIYLAGHFESCNGTFSPRLIRYRPSTDSFIAVEPALQSGTVLDLAWYQGELVVAGHYLLAQGGVGGGVLRWNGSGWAPLGAGAAGAFDLPYVRALVVHEGQLVAGGVFSSIGGQSAMKVARWNGSAWSPLGTGLGIAIPTQYVAALAVHEGQLIAGGNFSHSGATAGFQSVARWTGDSWQPLGQPGGRISSLLVDAEGSLIAAGTLLAAGAPVHQVKRWTGSQWAALAPDDQTGFDAPVEALALHDGGLVAGGSFTTFGSDEVRAVAHWNGSGWAAHPGTTAISAEDVPALLADGESLYVAAPFESGQGRGLHWIARLQGSWNRLGAPSGQLGFDGPIWHLASDGARLAAAGLFRRAGEVAVPGVAMWQGNEWQRLGNAGPASLTGVRAVAFFQNAVYAAGDFFDPTGTQVATGIARWRGDDWEPVVGEGAIAIDAGMVAALHVHEGELVVGGDYALSGGAGPVGVARWNGTRWALLEDGSGNRGPGSVLALTTHAGRLVAGGDFQQVGTVPASGLAAWDGSAWTGLVTGAQPLPVSALAVWQGDLYAGGDRRLERLQGNQWQSLAPGGTDWGIGSLVGLGDALWIGGDFQSLNGLAAVALARWDGTALHAVPGTLGSGPSSSFRIVNALAAHEGELMVGGHFRSIDGQRSAHVARLLPDVVDGIDMHIRAPVAAPDEGAHRIAYRLRLGNRGGAAALPATLVASAWPQPLAVTWTCEAGAFSSEPCPADTGNGLPAWTTAMAAGAEFYLDLVLDAAPGTVVQRLRLDLSAPPAAGADNRASTGLTVTTSLAQEVLFVEGFESAGSVATLAR
ncbi:MAG: hypothetical protein KF823_11300 [Xanthomonadales bacterium]|nr:hypothetical protein [Xanthomonadales bacterium]